MGRPARRHTERHAVGRHPQARPFYLNRRLGVRTAIQAALPSQVADLYRAEGHWDFGWGPKYDLNAMRALPEGSVVTVPAGSIIYDGCKQAPCVVETVGDGDDPEIMVDENGKTIARDESTAAPAH
jgi:hypothetical protein